MKKQPLLLLTFLLSITFFSIAMERGEEHKKLLVKRVDIFAKYAVENCVIRSSKDYNRFVVQDDDTKYMISKTKHSDVDCSETIYQGTFVPVNKTPFVTHALLAGYSEDSKKYHALCMRRFTAYEEPKITYRFNQKEACTMYEMLQGLFENVKNKYMRLKNKQK